MNSVLTDKEFKEWYRRRYPDGVTDWMAELARLTRCADLFLADPANKPALVVFQIACLTANKLLEQERQ